jgi:glycosyltransferase involved in cell wall biosynthesis
MTSKVKRQHEKRVSIAIPVFNGATTLKSVFAGLEEQRNKQIVKSLIIINDNSHDESLRLIKEYAKQSSYKVELINHNTSKGLANGYNEGIEHAKTPFVITMHQDMVIQGDNSFKKMLQPFDDPDVVVTYPVVLHPRSVWQSYNFWQKCLFSRFVDKELPMLTGKFDCFRKSYLKSVGYFDSHTFRTAGEDSDLKVKISKDSKKSVCSGVRAVHLQYIESNFSFKKLLRKEAQLAEAQGVILRRYGLRNPKEEALNFFRQILLIGLLIPGVNILCAGLVIIYAFAYTKNVYVDECSSPKVLILPFINIGLLFVALFASVRGFVADRQII